MAGYNDIEGSITTSGEPATRGGRSVSYEGAAMHLNTGNSPGGINTNAGNISLNVIGNINAPVLQARTHEADVNTVGRAAEPIVSPEVVQQGMGQLANAVAHYTDTMNAVKAKDAELALREKLFPLFHGNEKNEGYVAATGRKAVEGYSEFSNTINSAMQETLMSLNPAARLKAKDNLFQVAESYRAKGASHSEMEGRKIREGQKQAERSLITKELHAYPPDAIGKPIADENGNVILGKDGNPQFGASILKQRFFSTYDAHEFDQASKAWEGELVNAAERLYMDKRGGLDNNGNYKIGKGLEEAKIFRDTIGKLELSEDKLGEIDRKLFTWENHEMQQSLSSKHMQEVREEKNLKRMQNTTEASLFASMYDEKKPMVLTPHEVWKMAASGRISESGAAAYVSMARREATGDDVVSDLRTFDNLKRNLLDSADSNFIDGDTNYINEVVTAKDLNRNERKELINYASSLRQKESSSRVKIAYKRISASVPNSFDAMGKRTNVSLVVEQNAQREYDYLSEPKEGETQVAAHNRALDFVVDKYSKSDIPLQYMPKLYGGVKPKNMEDVNSILIKLKKDFDSQKLDKDVYLSYVKTAKEYMDIFGTASTKKSTEGL